MQRRAYDYINCARYSDTAIALQIPSLHWKCKWITVKASYCELFLVQKLHVLYWPVKNIIYHSADNVND